MRMQQNAASFLVDKLYSSLRRHEYQLSSAETVSIYIRRS